MPYELFWIADEPAIVQSPRDEGLAAGELRQLRELLKRLAGVAHRADLLRVVGDCMEGAIGAATFGVLERPAGRGAATLVAVRGDEVLLRRAAGHPRVRETLRCGTSHSRPAIGGGMVPPDVAFEPVASVPLWGMAGKVCGALVLAELVPPKSQLDSQDQRLLMLLAAEVGRLLCILPPDDRAEGAA